MAAAFFICASFIPTTSNCACVTTMRSQPASRAAAMRASACSADEWPVCTTSRWRAQTLRISRAAVEAPPPSSTTPMPAAAVPRCLTWLSASNVGNHTTRP